MFSGLRQNSIFYVLEKKNVQDEGEKICLKIGQVVSVSNPQPKYPTTYQFNPQGMDMTVNVSVKFPNEQIEFKELPANGQIANFENLVVSESREAIDSEVDALFRTSKDVVDSEPYHKQVMKDCNKIRSILNPQIAKDKQQEEDIKALKNEMSGVKGTLSDIQSMLSKALGNVGSKK